MLRDQMITFLETTVIFLLLTNAISIFAAAYAIAVATGAERRGREAGAVLAQRATGALTAVWPASGR